MEKFQTFTGVAAVLDVANVDTDQIIPKEFLKRVERSGFGQFLFYNHRFLPDGRPNPNFVLNQPRFAGASILLSGENFGCGSSREHAPWALLDYGFRVILARSFADIFRNNAFNIGILLIELPVEIMREWMKRANQTEGYRIEVDLAGQTLTGEDGFACFFSVDPHAKKRLLEGLDNIGLTLRHEAAIAAYEEKHAAPWQAATSHAAPGGNPA
ncbi:MAG: 3-isopropylmalate dehydratase small subunit [Deltaproteobacteria bacterium]|nr:3-isopropylmalate dehydratase small subunit [Deltaproteobacteria bacterium]